MTTLSDYFDKVLEPLMPLLDPNADARERTERQWQSANTLLRAAMAELSNEHPDHDAVIAHALTGLLSLQLSKT